MEFYYDNGYEDLLNKLTRLINEKCFHLLSHQIRMSYLNGVGSFTYYYSQLNETFVDFFKKNGFIVENEMHIRTYNTLYFIHSSLYKEDIEFITQWQDLSEEISNNFLRNKYDIPKDREIENSYRYSLDILHYDCIAIIYEFYTRGSEIEGNRHIEISKKELELKENNRYLEPIKLEKKVDVETFVKYLTSLNKQNIERSDLSKVFEEIMIEKEKKYSNTF